MKSIKPLIPILALGAASLSGLTYVVLKPATAKPVSAAKASMTVTPALPVQTEMPRKLAANGNITAWQEASIGSELGGLRLTEVRVNVGDSVNAGDVLAVFASDTVLADVAQARAQLLEAKAAAADASANAARARTLQSTGALSEQQIGQFLTAEQTAAARIALAQAALDAQQLRLKRTQVIAPDSGVVSARHASVGAVVGTGTELFRLIRQARLEWRAEVTAGELAGIRPGIKVSVKAANGGEVEGKVRTVAPTVDQQARTALVYVDLPAGEVARAGVKAGMFGSGEFMLGSSAAMTLPQQALSVRDGFHYVYRINSDSSVSQTKVRVGRRQGGQVEVLEGLPAGARVVGSGAAFLNDGDLVREADARSAALAAPKEQQ